MKKPPTPEHAALCRELADRLIVPLRDVARRLGYALAVHGTLARDIDLIAVPWSEGAVSGRVLAKAIQHRAREIVGHAEPDPVESRSSSPKWFRDGLAGYIRDHGQHRAKPHGRRGWTYYLTPTFDGPYIDLAVMPRTHPARRSSGPHPLELPMSTTTTKRRPAASYNKPHPDVHALDQRTCRALVSNSRKQGAILASHAAKAEPKGLCYFDESTCTWKATDEGRRLAEAPDIAPMVG